MTMAPERPVGEILEEQMLGALETPEIQTHERHFGNIEFQTLQLNSLILFSQIRDKTNARFAELEESIDNDDLDNPVNIARMSESELRDYIAFTNKTWGASTSVDDFASYIQPDGKYNVVVAGHSRTISIKNIAFKHTLKTGEPTNYTVLCKIEKDNSVKAIVGKQFLENIHAAVPPHREAEAIVEMYQQGLGVEWSTPQEFRAACKNVVSSIVLEKALAYGELPQQVRNLVTAKLLKYPVAVELGKAQQVYRKLKAVENDLPTDEPLPNDVEKTIVMTLMGDCMWMYREKFSQTAAVKEVQKKIVAWQAKIKEITGEDEDRPKKKPKSEDVVLDIENFMITPEMQYRMDLNRARQRRAREAEELLAGPLTNAAIFVHTAVENDENDPLIEAVIEDAETGMGVLANRRTASAGNIGNIALQDEGDDLFQDQAEPLLANVS